MHLLLGGERRRMILKVHTLHKWREGGKQLNERVSKVTAVKFVYAYWNAHTQMFDIDRQSEMKLLPVTESRNNCTTRGDAYCQKRYGELEWDWRRAGSMPSADPDTGTCEIKRVYDEVRGAIKLGQGMFHRGAMVTDKSMRGYHNGWKVTHDVLQVLLLLVSLSSARSTPSLFLLPSLSPSYTSHHLLSSSSCSFLGTTLNDKY